MKLCDLTQFYSPRSGGVKRYLHEKIRYLQAQTNDEHVLIVPGEKNEVIESERSRIYAIHSPLVSRTARYRALLDFRAIDEIVEREQPDLIESADPYQLGWKAIRLARARKIPALGFYHSHFAEAYLGGAQFLREMARRYVRKLYNQFATTLVASPRLASLLRDWGVENVRLVDLGVNTEIFCPQPDDRSATRESLGAERDCCLLLYIGRLGPEKNVRTLFRAFERLAERDASRFHLLVVGDGPERARLLRSMERVRNLAWREYCDEPNELAQLYRAADFLVHPGLQETFGLTTLEAQACGTPVIGIRGSDLDRLCFSGYEYWANENSAEALAQAIERAANEGASRGAALAEQVQSRYAWPVVFARLFEIYREIISDFKTPSFFASPGLR